VLVQLPEPFSFELTTERYRAFGRDLVNAWENGRLHRVVAGREIAIEEARGGVRVRPGGGAAVQAEVLRLLGAPFDLVGFAAFAETSDPVLGRLVRELLGLRPSLAPDPFEALVGSITAQQVSLRAAFAIRARLVERFGERHDLAWAFPARERIASASPEELRALGYSTRKADYVVALARSDLELDALAALPDDEVKRELIALPGLGEWTADWFLARHLGRPDAWPAGDLALRKAVAALYLDGGAPTVEEVRTFGGRFAGHRNLAAHYLLVGNRVRGTRLWTKP
jgi:3-methyladenine DNA glycosylase/8-oxoguanine DNA glycosylase